MNYRGHLTPRFTHYMSSEQTINWTVLVGRSVMNSDTIISNHTTAIHVLPAYSRTKSSSQRGIWLFKIILKQFSIFFLIVCIFVANNTVYKQMTFFKFSLNLASHILLCTCQQQTNMLSIHNQHTTKWLIIIVSSGWIFCVYGFYPYLARMNCSVNLRWNNRNSAKIIAFLIPQCR